MAESIFGKFQDYLNAYLDDKIGEIRKSEEPTANLNKIELADGTVSRKGLIFDPFVDQYSQMGLFKAKASYLSNAILKQVSRRDGIVASILDLRSSQVSSFCKKQTDRFGWGFKIMPKDKTIEPDPGEVRKIEEFILNCGLTEDRKHEDKLTFDQFGYIVTRDMQVYGHFAIEKVVRNDKDLYAFLPLPAETIFYANKNVDKKAIKGMIDTWARSIRPEVDKDKFENGEYQYVQVLQNQVVEGFTADEIIFARHNLESDVDLNGYCYGPLERAMSSIISHMQVENHQRQFFTHGVASKGLLVLQGDVAPNTLKTLQTQWNNQITGPMNAWRTPILAGIKGVQWVPLTATNRDMEYAAWQDYVIRVMCTAMAVNPEEIGFDYLSKGTEGRSMSESNNEWKLTASRDRGLRPILGRIEAVINEEVLPAFNKEFSNKYHFAFVGLESETEMEETERLLQETQLHTTLNEARKQTDKQEMQFGGNLILNPLLIQTLQTNMTKGDFMEKIMGVQGASQRPDLQYIPDPMWFQWQQMQQQIMQAQAGGPPDGGSQGAEGDESGQDQPQDPQQAAQQQEEQDPEAQQAQMQAQQNAVNQYIAANPELFKAMNHNLNVKDTLQKSQVQLRKQVLPRIEKQRDELVKDFRKASDDLVKEIMQIVATDLKDKK